MEISDDLIAWVRLARSLPIGAVAFSVLKRMYDDPHQMLSALPKIIKKSATYGKSICSKDKAIKEIKAVESIGGQFITYGDRTYPKLLRYIRSAPVLLTALGDVSILSQQALGIVGSRNASGNSLRFARKISCDLAEAGYVIVSGLAKGVDTVAHGVVEFDKPTVAVMASGIDVVYPASNKDLYKKIAEKGVIITESPFGTAPKACLFPQRNRIISGLSMGIVVIEASATSGSLITAKFALAQGREVFAVPGFPMDSRYSGNNYLLKEGAGIVENADDIINAFANYQMSFDYGQDIVSEGSQIQMFVNKFNKDKEALEREAMKNKLMQLLGDSPIGIEELLALMCAKEGDENLIMESILELELEDAVERHPGNTLSLVF